MTDKDESTTSYFVEVVDRAVTVLQTVANAPGLGVSEIARRCGDGKARTYRLLCTLEKRGLVSRHDGGSAYQLGYAAVVLGAAASAQFDLVRMAQPILDDLGRELNETVKLRLRDGLEVIGVAKWEPDRDVRCHSQIGRRHPLYSDPGKLLLAYSSPEIQAGVLSEMLQASPKLEAASLQESLAQIRADGIHITTGDTPTPSDAISLDRPRLQRATGHRRRPCRRRAQKPARCGSTRRRLCDAAASRSHPVVGARRTGSCRHRTNSDTHPQWLRDAERPSNGRSAPFNGKARANKETAMQDVKDHSFDTHDVAYLHHGPQARCWPVSTSRAEMVPFRSSWMSMAARGRRTIGRSTSISQHSWRAEASSSYRSTSGCPRRGPYPAAIADINFAIRWVKANALTFKSTVDRVGGLGTSSGGHQILLSAMRPFAPDYASIDRAEVSGFDASLAFVMSGWGVLDPLQRYQMAKAQDKTRSRCQPRCLLGQRSPRWIAAARCAFLHGTRPYRRRPPCCSRALRRSGRRTKTHPRLRRQLSPSRWRNRNCSL